MRGAPHEDRFHLKPDRNPAPQEDRCINPLSPPSQVAVQFNTVYLPLMLPGLVIRSWSGR